MRHASLLCLLLAAPAAAQDDPAFGFWRTESGAAVVAVAPCGAQACGTIVSLAEPTFADGAPKTDRRNPDPALRDRPVCGMALMGGFDRDAPGVWSGGEIYSAEDGETYSATMRAEGDRLRLRGYVGLPVFGATQVWTREPGPGAPC